MDVERSAAANCELGSHQSGAGVDFGKGSAPGPGRPAAQIRDESTCRCGHPFAPNHQTPGAECFVYGCDCNTFRESDVATSTEDARESLFVTLRAQVMIRERPLLQGLRPHPMVDPTIVITLDEAKAILDLYDAARECAEWHIAQGTKHVTDVTLWEAVTGRDRRADA